SHSWDIDGRVLLGSSFRKSSAPGQRVGWVAPGRDHDKLMHMKYAISSLQVPSTQMAAATFGLEGHYHRHIRRMRQTDQR
ncbi:GntR family transcriptional regulator, partial [Escherichia coli]